MRPWAGWHNTERLHGYLGGIPSAEFETTFCYRHQADKTLAEIK